jgi:hypothetical protein
VAQFAQRLRLNLADAFASDCERLADFERVLRTASRYGIKCGATMPMNSRDVITLVFFQNLGECRWLTVIR